ncbi:hypothetical protein SAMN04487895_12731 [Paenibacillus sophorae]|uniref:Uncharacterized protein n=1 Tax=Paenibacillus sophorae TaxID=1333845 RepID=A0A1H8VSQ0_9BACL|nr:hypothetical protein [Paenibacillus sophorae]QWU15685.1 hypothetical protein KP014_28370 [Paenibacillus sophorae]SEP18334.1 hypothetical protein SAMN04487895_12731 [Paenibacillus sophorae]
MALTPEEQLIELYERRTEIQTAISAILGGAQEYSINGRSLKRPDLGLLYKERDRLDQEIRSLEAPEESASMFRRAYFEGR